MLKLEDKSYLKDWEKYEEARDGTAGGRCGRKKTGKKYDFVLPLFGISGV